MSRLALVPRPAQICPGVQRESGGPAGGDASRRAAADLDDQEMLRRVELLRAAFRGPDWIAICFYLIVVLFVAGFWIDITLRIASLPR